MLPAGSPPHEHQSGAARRTGHSAHTFGDAAAQKLVNTIQAHVRAGPSRPRSSYDELCRQLRGAWETVLPATPLDTISVHGSLVAGEEKGFLRPEAGHDAEWVREHMAEFERLAAAGDEEMKALVEECRSGGLGV